jgi:acetate kinase
MGLTPLEGLPGATRSGSLDPSLIFHYTSSAAKISSSSTERMHITQAEDILNKKSGWKALTGTTDFGVIMKKAAAGDEMAQLAVDLFVDRVVGYIGSYWVKLGGKVDALVFAGGIGEKGKEFRQAVCGQVECLGIRLDGGRNERVGNSEADVLEISSGAGVKTLVVETDEQVYPRGCICIEVDCRLRWLGNVCRWKIFGRVDSECGHQSQSLAVRLRFQVRPRRNKILKVLLGTCSSQYI